MGNSFRHAARVHRRERHRGARLISAVSEPICPELLTGQNRDLAGPVSPLLGEMSAVLTRRRVLLLEPRYLKGFSLV